LTLSINSDSQQPNGYDTLYTRAANVILIPTYDTVKQLEVANQKADTLLMELRELQKMLCKMSKDTIK
jgi:hypothetical protein